jgi:hypothetical protein
MHDKALILVIIMVVLAGLAAPFIYSRMGAGAPWPPKLDPPPGGEKKCVESKEYMRERHVDLLMQWRDARVRHGVLKYTASDGREYVMSLTQTCIGCHSNKAEFCDRCHDRLSVHPPCWDCHTYPQKGDAAK